MGKFRALTTSEVSAVSQAPSPDSNLRSLQPALPWRSWKVGIVVMRLCCGKVPRSAMLFDIFVCYSMLSCVFVANGLSVPPPQL